MISANTNVIFRPLNCSLPGTAQGASTTDAWIFKGTEYSSGDQIEAFIRIPAGSLGQGRPFKILAGGRCEVGAGNFYITFTAGSSTTAGANTTIATSGAVAGADGCWMVIFEGYVESDNDLLTGTIRGFIGATAISLAVNTPAAFDPAAEQYIAVEGDASSSNASNLMTLEFFEVQSL